MIKKMFSILMSICISASAVIGFQKDVIVSAKEKGVTDYTYTITPLLEPFNQYFFVKTDNPDPTSFRFADKASKYSEDAAIAFDYDDWSGEVILYPDINYENIETGRVNGGYIFKSFDTDGGEVVLQSKNDAYYSWDVTWSDTNVRLRLSPLKDNADYLIDTYADRSSFFDNMDAVQTGFESICFYSGSYIRGRLVKTEDFWSLASAGHIDQSFYIFSPYSRENSRSLFASAVYPFRYDSLGFPGMMGEVSKRLDRSSSYQWNSSSHAEIDVTYGGETRTYGGQGSGKGKGISEDRIIQYFSFGQSGTKITLTDLYRLLEAYAAVRMEDDIPREDALTWKKIYEDVQDGAWAQLKGNSSNEYAYFYRKGKGDNFDSDEWGVGYSLYWSGDLGYARDAWVDGRYVGEWRKYIPGEKFEDHRTSNIILNNVTIPQITYDYDYEYNYDTERYEKKYSNIHVTESSKTVLFRYDTEKNIWIAEEDAFDDGWSSGYSKISELTEMGLLAQKYLDMVTLTPDEVEVLHVDRNTASVPEEGFNYDGTVEPGTPFKHVPQEKNIKLDKATMEIYVGETGMLTVTVEPSDESDDVVWTSSDTRVASVNNGRITGVSKGTAVITAKLDNGKTADCTVTVREKPVSVKYRTHVQTYGWQEYVKDGAMSGTSGKAKRLEAINIQLDDQPLTGSIEYRTHVQTYGWQNWVKDGNLSGTSGKAKRLEAIQIRLTGEMAQQYDIWYRVHAQHFGWLDWAKNGSSAGTEGYAYRLEAIEIRLVKKGEKAPGSVDNPFYIKDRTAVNYRTHVQTYGWQNWVKNGSLSGTAGQAKRLEAINIKLSDQSVTGDIEYRTHVQTYGWQDWVKNGNLSGTSGKAKRLEAIQIRLTGEMAKKYDIYYRVHAQHFGWLDWASNGQSAGTAGYGYRLEAIEIKLVEKGKSAPGSTKKCFYNK